MNRRALLAATALAWTPRIARTQEVGRRYRVGVLAFNDEGGASSYHRTFERALAAQGFIPSKNLEIHYVHAGSGSDVPERARRLLAHKPDVVFTANPFRVRAVRAVSDTVPIVFAFVGDPVQAGFVRDLARPGGNTTGVANLYAELFLKRVELVRLLLPSARRVALAVHSQRMAFAPDVHEELMAKARGLGLSLELHDVSGTAVSLDRIAANIVAGRPDVVMPYGALYEPGRDVDAMLARLQREHRIPLIDHDTASPGVVSLGVDEHDEMARAAVMVARILRGAHPSSLPVDRASRVELVVNTAAARALGITVPAGILSRADRLVER